LLRLFESGQLDSAQWKDLAHSSDHLEDHVMAEKIANDYINNLSNESLYSTVNIHFMIEFTKKSSERGFTVFREHPDKICLAEPTIHKAQLRNFIDNIIYNEDIRPFEHSKDGKPDWAQMEKMVAQYGELGKETLAGHRAPILFNSEIAPELKKDPDWNRMYLRIKQLHAGKGEEFLVGSSIVYYLNAGLLAGTENDCSNFMAAARLYFKQYYGFLSPEPMNLWAWTVFQRSSKRSELLSALNWSDSSIRRTAETNGNLIDTYANLLYKLGRRTEALSWEKKAIILSPDDAAIQSRFAKMKKGDPTWLGD
jgi:hypothetical protein